MNYRFPHPDNEISFEKFCLKLLQRHWNNPHLELYGRRGERQYGVDIIDPTFGTPYRAAQCKHHEAHITIPPAEIEAEVTKALNFDRQLNHYAILTTGRVTTHAQNKIIEINRNHRSQGLFTVELFSWEKIEGLLDEYPDVADLLTKVTNSQLSSINERLDKGFVAIRSQLADAAAVAGDGIDGLISEAESHLKIPDPQRAQIEFEKIRQKHWDQLTAQQKYRVKVGLSNVALTQGKDKEAGKLLLEAKDLCPDSERAIINEAIGLDLLGKKSEAYALACKLVKLYPSAGKLVACLIRTAPVDMSFEAAEALTSPATENDPDVCLALAIKAMNLGRFAEGEHYARRAVEAYPDTFGPRFFLAQALLNAEASKLSDSFRSRPTKIDREKLTEALSTIDSAIGFAKKSQASHVLSDSALIRALIHAMRGESKEAEADFQEALRQGPDNSPAYHRFASFLFNQGRDSEAIAVMQRMPALNTDNEAAYFLAGLLSERDKPGDRNEAIEIYKRIAITEPSAAGAVESVSPKSKSENIHVAAFHSAVEEMLDASRFDEAEELLIHAKDGVISLASQFTARSRIALARGDQSHASALADEAIRHVNDESSILDRRTLAIQLGRLERHKDALPLWLKINEEAGYGNDARHLVGCAERINRYDVVLDVAAAARNSNIVDKWLLFKEIDILEMFDLPRAVTLIQNWIDTHPEDKFARCRLSQIGLKWNRPELVDARPESLPSLEEATAASGAFAVEVMRKHGDANEALRYAYELVRRHFDDPDANAALVSVFFAPDSGELQIPNAELASPGTAVRFAEGENERWIVIEDAPNPRQERAEFPPNHPLAAAFLGKRAGDTVTISKTSGRDRLAKIKEIKHKYLYRLHEIMESWQLRFPDQPFIQVFRVIDTDPATGQEKPDFTDLKLVADKRFERITEAEELYRKQFIPIHVFSEIVGCDAFQGFHHVARSTNMPIRCCRGQPEERSAALAALGSCPNLVLDITALASISLLQIVELLKNWRGKCVISQETAALLSAVADDSDTKKRATATFGKSSKGYFLQEHSPEESKSAAESLAAFINDVLAASEVRSCPELAEIDPEQRDLIVSVFGQHGAESMLLARAPGHILWTDDMALREKATEDFSVRGAWTQIVLEYATTEGIIQSDDYLEASAKLLGMDYEATMFNIFTVVKAGVMSGWHIETWPFNKALDKFAGPQVPVDDVVILAAAMVTNMYKEHVLVETRQATFIRILERLAARRGGLGTARTFIAMLPRIFGINVLAAQETTEVGNAWLSEASRRSRFYGSNP